MTTTDNWDHPPGWRVQRRVQSWAFERLYGWGRWLYDPLTWLLFGQEWAHWRAAGLSAIESGPVLDLGSGTGALLADMARTGLVATGVDRSPAMLAAAARRRHGRDAFGLVRADAGRLPFADGAFGAVVATFPAAFILDPAVASEIARVLRPGGAIVVVVGGKIERWEPWRQPLRAALALFYGREGSGLRPGAPLIDHRLLPGAWREATSPRGRAHLWVGRRA